MKISKAVITAAGPGQNSPPLQNVVDRNGFDKSALQLVIEEAVEAGVGDICVVVCPGDVTRYREAAGDHAGRLTFAEQPAPRGYGDALFRAADFVGRDPFLHLVGDHLYLSRSRRGCAKQLVELATAESCAVSAVQATRENMLPYFGTIGAKRLVGRNDLYRVHKVIEKPTPTAAEQELVVAGLRSSHYLCLFGMHVLTSTVMELLRQTVEDASHTGSIQLSPALSELSNREKYLALEVDGVRYNIGMKYGLLISQLALALAGKDRDQILTELLDLVVNNPPTATQGSNE